MVVQCQSPSSPSGDTWRVSLEVCPPPPPPPSVRMKRGSLRSQTRTRWRARGRRREAVPASLHVAASLTPSNPRPAHFSES